MATRIRPRMQSPLRTLRSIRDGTQHKPKLSTIRRLPGRRRAALLSLARHCQCRIRLCPREHPGLCLPTRRYITQRRPLPTCLPRLLFVPPWPLHRCDRQELHAQPATALRNIWHIRLPRGPLAVRAQSLARAPPRQCQNMNISYKIFVRFRHLPRRNPGSSHGIRGAH